MDVGTHDGCRVVDTALSDSNGKLTIAITFANQQNQRITAFQYTTDAAWSYTEKNLITLGWDPEANDYAFERLNENPSPLLNAECQLVVEADTYEGKTRNKVRWINAPGGGVKRLDRESAGGMAAMLRERIKERRNNPPPAQPLPAGMNDTIPF